MNKRILFFLLLLSSLLTLTASAQQQVILQDSVVGQTHLTADKTYLLRGFVYVVNGATLTIDPGTLIYGEKSSKGSLIVERGGKLIAVGTAQKPIIFTSQQPIGQRAAGDWGGIILCGRAPINQNNSDNGGTAFGGDAQIEGGPRSHYGGTIYNDNSGDLEYVRIEFPGIAFAPNSEINGLTFGGVGAGTVIDHIQVSYSGDDNYEWFGGNVNCKHLIGFKGLDDDWDTDFGYTGRVQFGVSLRDPNIADQSLSNGFESDNDATSDFWNPRTAAIFCNMTVCGPQSDTSKTYNSLFGRGAHIRRSSQLNIFNSIVMGEPTGLLIDGGGVVNGAINDTVQIRSCIWAGLRSATSFLTTVGSFDVNAWYKTSTFRNLAFAQPAEVMLTDPFNQFAPNWRPLANSPALLNADFTYAKLANDNSITKVNYVGAFDPVGARWDSLWSNYDPQNSNYNAVLAASITDINFPNTFVSKSKDSAVVLIKNTGVAPLQIVAVGILDSTNFRIVSGSSVPFTLTSGETKSITLRFAPTTAAADLSTKIKFISADNQSIQINLKGTGIASAPILSVESSHDFALVRLTESNIQTISVKNTGAASLDISGIAISGADAADFTFVSGNTAASIAPGASQSIVIKFAPTTIGSKTATLKFLHNAPSGTQAITLTGIGIEVLGQEIAKDSISANVNWTNDRTWLIRGFLYVVNGATLTIEPGTTIYGEKASKGSLIVERGGKLIAKGTQDQPIVFTSQQAPGQRQSGDWGGIILCGRAPINQNNSANGGTIAGGDAQIEGGPRSHYGGSDIHDNSGDLEFIRIEFPGIPFAPNSEINGLTFGGVGDATIIDHIQVSYSGDDNYEWFGGTVNCKHLIGFKGLDDDWDTDFGYSGKVQFGVSLRDPNIADQSLSNGFESDNDATSDYWNPRTSATFCNMTVLGPQSDTTKVVNSLFGRGAHIRRSSQLNIFNSINMGWPTGLLLDGAGVVNGAKQDTVQIRNCIWAGLHVGKDFTTTVAGFDPSSWFKTGSFANSTFVQPSEVKLMDAFNLNAPNFTPASGSPALSGASFSMSKLSDPFFEQVGYRGAFGPGPRWDSVWTNYNPQNTVYAPKPGTGVTTVNFGAIPANATKDSTISVILTNTGNVVLAISEWGFNDSTKFTIIGGRAAFVLKAGESKSVTVRFTPAAKGNYNANLLFNFVTKEGTVTVPFTGTASDAGVDDENLVNGVKLFTNVPNPFANSTTVSYYLPKPSMIQLEVLDLTGKRISLLENGMNQVGLHSVKFDANDLANGLYILRLNASGLILTKQILLSK